MSLANYFAAQERTRTAVQDCERAAYNRDLCRMRERIAMLISQHEPVNGTGLDRDKLACVLRFVEHGQLARLSDELVRCTKIKLVPTPATSPDGWISWLGGNPPVADGALLDIRLRNGDEVHGQPVAHWRWAPMERPADIIAYRRAD